MPSTAPSEPNHRELLATSTRAGELRALARDWPSWDLDPRQLCDLELLLDGGFAPLEGFLGRAATDSVCRDLRLPDGTLWPMPIVLDVPQAVAEQAVTAGKLALRDAEGLLLAVLHVEEAWELDQPALAAAVCGTADPDHPGVALHLAMRPTALGGRIEGVHAPVHHDYPDLRRTPAQVRALLAAAGHPRVVAFQTRNPLHRAHHAMTERAMRELDAALLLHPVVGMTKPGDVDHHTRVRCYRALLPYYPAGRVTLSLLPLAMRMAGPREALWHAAIRRNFGASHFIVGRDHAGPGSDRQGRPFYGPYDAQELVARHADELGIGVVRFEEMVFVPATTAPNEVAGTFVQRTEVPAGATPRDLSGTELRARLQHGDEIPSWFTFPEVAAELRKTAPPRYQQGFTIFFTGLSGAGKSTIANVLLVRLLAGTSRPVTLLDGDLVRKHLSSELGFSRAHRDLNIQRIGFVASEVTRHGGIAICAPIAPYASARAAARGLIAEHGGFYLVHVATSLEVCEQRDRKGLYAKARAGLVQGFTGISDPYEEPTDAELVIDAGQRSPGEAVDAILDRLRADGYLPPADSSTP
jgi:sulfate adenylyltransferase